MDDNASTSLGRIKLRMPVLVGNLTVSQYVLHRDGVDVPQWLVSSADGKEVIGPFSGLDAAMKAAKEEDTSCTDSIGPPSEVKAAVPFTDSDASKFAGPKTDRMRLSLNVVAVWLREHPGWLIGIVIAAVLLAAIRGTGTKRK